MNKQATITFIKSKPENLEWFFDLHRASLKKYVEAIWGWDESWQEKKFPSSISFENTSIIKINDNTAGRLSIKENQDHYFLEYIALLPKYRNYGYGSKILDIIFNTKPIKNIKLTILNGNPVKSLYLRNGFTIYKRDKERTFMIKENNVITS